MSTKVKFDSKKFERSLNKKINKIATDYVQTVSTNQNCPHCDKIISVKAGSNVCPFCNKHVNVTVNLRGL